MKGNSKSTKRALYASITVVILCIAMLIGTTFAWFTDSASTNVSNIQSGKFGVDLVDSAGDSLKNKTIAFAKAEDAPSDEAVLWEPGATYKLATTVRVQNTGKLALKYELKVDGVEGDEKLLDVVKFKFEGLDMDATGHLTPKGTAGDTSAPITVSATMDEDAGNEYQGLSIGGVAITVVAAQDTVEYDSNGNDYDENATYPWSGGVDVDGLIAATDPDAMTVEISTAAQLAAFAAEVNSGTTYAGYTVTLMRDLDLASTQWTPVGNSVGGTKFVGTFDGNGKTITNLRVTTKTNVDAGLFGSVSTNGVVKNLTIDGAYVSNRRQTDPGSSTAVGILSARVFNGTVQNCTVKNATAVGSHFVGGIVGHIYGPVTGCTVENLNIDCFNGGPGMEDGNKAGGIIGYAGEGKYSVTGNTVRNSAITSYRDAAWIVGCKATSNPTVRDDELALITGNTATKVTVTSTGGANVKNDYIGSIR